MTREETKKLSQSAMLGERLGELQDISNITGLEITVGERVHQETRIGKFTK